VVEEAEGGVGERDGDGELARAECARRWELSWCLTHGGVLVVLFEAEADREVWRGGVGDDDGDGDEAARNAEADARSFPGRMALDWRTISSRVFCCRSSRSEWSRAR
jgi:hypothetical protein